MLYIVKWIKNKCIYLKYEIFLGFLKKMSIKNISFYNFSWNLRKKSPFLLKYTNHKIILTYFTDVLYSKTLFQFQFFVGLLREFLPDRETLKELLNFKFSAFKENNEEGNNTPESLYHVTALLIQHEILTLQDVYPWVRNQFSTNLIQNLFCEYWE